MKLSYDPLRNARNEQERGLSFEAPATSFETAKFWVDDRQDDRETRSVALGYLDRRLHVLVFMETGDGVRVISFRQANAREAKKHGFAQDRHR